MISLIFTARQRATAESSETALHLAMDRQLLLDEVISESAILHIRLPQLGTPSLTQRLPKGVAGAPEILVELLVDLVAGVRLGAAQLAHVRRVTAIGPVIQGMFDDVHAPILDLFWT